MNRNETIIPAHRGWYVESRNGNSSEVIAWVIGADMRPKPVTVQGVAIDGELTSPSGERHRVD